MINFKNCLKESSGLYKVLVNHIPATLICGPDAVGNYCILIDNKYAIAPSSDVREFAPPLLSWDQLWKRYKISFIQNWKEYIILSHFNGTHWEYWNGNSWSYYTDALKYTTILEAQQMISDKAQLENWNVVG